MKTTQSRPAILDAALALALASDGATSLKLTEVASKAGVSSTDLKKHFKDRRTLLLALLLHCQDIARAETIEAMAAAPSQGPERITYAFRAYLDACLRLRPLRELAVYLRSDAEGGHLLRAREHGFAVIVETELRAFHWPWPSASARMAVLMCLETLGAEYKARKALPEMRAALASYFRDPPPKAE